MARTLKLTQRQLRQVINETMPFLKKPVVITHNMLRGLIKEEIYVSKRRLSEDVMSSRHTLADYGLEPEADEALLRSLEDEYGDDLEHAMLVDDMEGLGLRDAINVGDEEGARAVISTITAEYPRDSYDPFGNGFSGSEPVGSPN